MNNKSLKKLVRASIIAAVYVTISLVFLPLSYGAVQVRFAEALTLLPVVCPESILGVTVGCLLTNMIGSSPIDMVFGTFATLISAICTYKLANIRIKKLPIAAAIPPIIINAIIVGFEITYFFSASQSTGILLFNMLTVGLGQIVSCGILGVALIKLIENNEHLKNIFVD